MLYRRNGVATAGFFRPMLYVGVNMHFRVLILAFALTVPVSGLALEFTLSIQPILPKKQIADAYQPLADYLSQRTGHTIKIRPHNNFITYWAAMRRPDGFDLALDAAHFTDYRVRKQDYSVLAKIPDTVSFSIVTHEYNLVFDTDELVLKTVATLVCPSVGALRLNELFKDPMRQPKIRYARDANDAARMVNDKRVFAAIIPTALVGRYESLNTVTTTDSLPHMAISASATIPVEVRQQIRSALLSATDTEGGRKMLEQINFPSFEPTSAEHYSGFHQMLEDVLGY